MRYNGESVFSETYFAAAESWVELVLWNPASCSVSGFLSAVVADHATIASRFNFQVSRNYTVNQ